MFHIKRVDVKYVDVLHQHGMAKVATTVDSSMFCILFAIFVVGLFWIDLISNL